VKRKHEKENELEPDEHWWERRRVFAYTTEEAAGSPKRSLSGLMYKRPLTRGIEVS